MKKYCLITILTKNNTRNTPNVEKIKSRPCFGNFLIALIEGSVAYPTVDRYFKRNHKLDKKFSSIDLATNSKKAVSEKKLSEKQLAPRENSIGFNH